MKKTIENFLKDVLIVMVIYRCTPEKSTTWASLMKEAEKYKAVLDLYLCDHSPQPQAFPPSEFIKINYRHNPDNPGVSEVYNEGCRIARKQNKRWLLLLDQDTSFSEGWFDQYFQSTMQHPETAIKAPVLSAGGNIISPFRYWATKGVSSRSFEPGVYSLKNYFAINSGLLVDREVFEAVGGYDESIPLDFSDFAFMNRLKKNNYQINIIAVFGKHELSSVTCQDRSSTLERFKMYCLGSKRLTTYTHQSLLHFIIGGGRAIRLGMRYRSLNFVFIFIRLWIIG